MDVIIAEASGSKIVATVLSATRNPLPTDIVTGIRLVQSKQKFRNSSNHPKDSSGQVVLHIGGKRFKVNESDRLEGDFKAIGLTYADIIGDLGIAWGRH